MLPGHNFQSYYAHFWECNGHILFYYYACFEHVMDMKFIMHGLACNGHLRVHYMSKIRCSLQARNMHNRRKHA
jgi:hypothetical protein